MKSEIKGLTGVRFLAALWVMCFHFFTGEKSGFISRFIHFGFTGVVLFFVLSGFVLMYVYGDATLDDAARRRNFWVARAGRILPVYYLSWLLIAPFAILHRVLSDPSGQTPRNILASASTSLTLMHAWIAPLATTWNAPSWTLCVEAFCYACFPWIVRWLGRFQQRQLLMTVGVCWVAGTAPATVLSWAPKSFQMFTFDPLLHLPAFVAGAAVGRLYMLRVQGRAAVERSANWIGVAGSAGLLTAICLLPLHAADGLARTGIFIPFFCAIVYGLAAGTWFSKPLSGRTMNVLGEASYSAYLLQYVVWYTYFAVVNKFAVMDYTLAVYDHQFAPLRFLALTALLLVMSIVSFRYFESPARRYIRGRLTRSAALRMPWPARGRAPLSALSIPPNTPIKTFD